MALFTTKPFIYETEARSYFRVVLDTAKGTGTAQMIANQHNTTQRVNEPRIEFAYDLERSDKRGTSYFSRAALYGPTKDLTLEELLTTHS